MDKVKKYSEHLSSTYGISLFYQLFDYKLMEDGKSSYINKIHNYDNLSSNEKAKISTNEINLANLASRQGYTTDLIRKIIYYLTALSYDERYMVTKFNNNFIDKDITIKYTKHNKDIFYIYRIYFDKYSPKHDDCKFFFEVNIQLYGLMFKIIIQMIEVEL